MASGGRWHIDARRVERHAQVLRERAAKGLVLVGSLAPDLMIEMRNTLKDQLIARVQIVQEANKCDRVGAARHGGDDTRIGTPERVAVGKVRDAGEERHLLERRQTKDERQKARCSRALVFAFGFFLLAFFLSTF